MHVKYRQDNLHRMTWYTGTCGSNGHGLTIHVSFMVNVCVLYEGFGSIGFVTTVQPFQWFGHYRTDVISRCGPPEVGLDRATNVTYGMLCNGWGTGIVL
jgi:hypothetical protein